MILSLLKLNPQDQEDQKYTYDILKYRWSISDIVNIKHKTPKELPSFENHIEHITSDFYKVFYKILLGGEQIGLIYINKYDVNSTFIVPNMLKSAIRKIGKNNLKNELSGKQRLSYLIHTTLFSLHPEIETHYATVSTSNKLSLDTLTYHGYEVIEYVLAMKTKNGKVKQGIWTDESE
jgi:hypothetical protein